MNALRPPALPAVLALLHRQRAALALGALCWFGALLTGWFAGGEMRGTVVRTPAEPGAGLWWSIFSANASVALLAFAGVITFGLVTALFSLVSGMLTGLGLAQATALGGSAVMVRHILPHAVVEMPAIAVAVGAGLVPLAAGIRVLAGRAHKRPRVRDMLVDSVALLGCSLFLLLIAATIETWVST
ncbi:stage II sporulation protein M [Streptomyces sp. NPDC021093]|uniref:stage II sporulation protein M n=1 Tax=Streptomyces sp. NPDC021093 TaxID=3365112 RepID=UPI0037AEDF8B